MGAGLRPVLALLVAALVLLAVPAAAAPGKAVFAPLRQRLIRDGYPPAFVHSLFERPEVRFDPRVMPRKLTHDESRIDYARFLRPERLARAHAFLDRNRDLLVSIEARFLVPKEIKVAILLVETDLGRYLGAGRAFNILASMAAAGDLERVRPWIPGRLLRPETVEKTRRLLRKKARWAYEELKALIEYAARNGQDLLSIRGSIFGAIGLCQFMPTNALRFGVDEDGDGRVDLFEKPDALASMANYLRCHGWEPEMDREKQEAVILSYNPSRPYARTVLAVAERLQDMETRVR
ncbi:lytic murein transglycosylase [Dissulfurirhabdus thermomarina]|uniref:Lytic murein transglycosylase n=1 Tax=Dissulfurirhabdus thermomarina TaxID=1765737 RepID=A0A6N9TT06_DISTH|nr:lytic murein transglycosylase [Dissulfurirhabdus thermomarina]NMX23719.1 lytic murein transglycosylase [Dissulfurirhabdus thermomarina]